MLKKTIKYQDFNGVDREEVFMFHLSKAELMEMEMGTTGGLAESIQKVVEAQDTVSIIKIFKDIILKSYGEKSADGKRFVKVSDAGVPLSIGFSQTEAFSTLFMELATNADEAAKFIQGIIPSDIEIPEDQLKQITQNNQ